MPLNVDLCVIGGGSGGLSVAAGAVQMGAQTVLIEQHRMGGECLNYGCVPSKALLAASHRSMDIDENQILGIKAHDKQVNWEMVHKHVHGVIERIAPHDSVERFTGLGVKVIKAQASFMDHKTVRAGDYQINARYFVIATGSRPAIPAIPGLDKVAYLTNETFFDSIQPMHLIVIGGGPIGIEMAQAHCGLGSRVTVLEQAKILFRDDEELADLLRKRLLQQGMDIRENVVIDSVVQKGNEIQVHLGNGETVTGSHILVSTGRVANIEHLNLQAAGIQAETLGVKTDERLRTKNKRVFAIGDVSRSPRFTHIASYHAGIVIKNALFRIPAKVNYTALPWVTYTTPELAHVGLSEQDVKKTHHKYRVLRWSFEDNDRAQTEHTTEGLIKVIVKPNGRILGATILAAHAGELITLWGLAMDQKLKISAIANMIIPYPTLSEVSKRVAGSFYTPMLFSDRVRFLVRCLGKLG